MEHSIANTNPAANGSPTHDEETASKGALETEVKVMRKLLDAFEALPSPASRTRVRTYFDSLFAEHPIGS